MDIADVKLYLRVDGTDEDTLIQGLMDAAAQYIKKATGKNYILQSDGTYADIEQDKVFMTCEKMMVEQWYENRGDQSTSNLTKISFAVEEMLKHIMLCDDYTTTNTAVTA